jgi:hypothetical protein
VIGMEDCAADVKQNGPVTLHAVMRNMMAEGLKAHYEAPRRLSHELFVLLLQLKERERGTTAAAKRSPSRAKPPKRRKPPDTAASPPP